MLAKPYRLFGLVFSLLLLAACQNAGKQESEAIESKSPSSSTADPNLDSTLRKAAADAEATYNYAEAAQHYAVLLEKHPDDQDVILDVARNLRYSGSPQQAVSLVSKHISTTGPKEPLLIELGKDYLASDQLNLAIAVLQQAQTLDPKNWQILSAIGVAQDYQGNYKDAQASYLSGLKLSVNNPTLLNNYALSLAQSGQLDQAIATLQTAVAEPASTAQARQNLALMLALKGDKAGATRLIRSDLPPDMAQNNISYYQGLASQ